MQDETATRPTEREQKYALRREIAAWQKAAIGLLVLSLAVNLLGGAYITQERKHHALEVESLRVDVEIAQAKHDQVVARLDAAERDKQFALNRLEEIALSNTKERQTQTEADTGGAIKGNKIDLAVPTHEEAEKFGIRTAEVWIKEENDRE